MVLFICIIVLLINDYTIIAACVVAIFAIVLAAYLRLHNAYYDHTFPGKTDRIRQYFLRFDNPQTPSAWD